MRLTWPRPRPVVTQLTIYCLLIASFSYAITVSSVHKGNSTSDSVNSLRITGTIDSQLLEGVNKGQVSISLGQNHTQINLDSSFRIRGSQGASGLVTLAGPKNTTLGLAFLPKPRGTQVNSVSVNFLSTAIGLVATYPGVMTGKPELDLLIEAALARSPDISAFAQSLTEMHSRYGADYLVNGHNTVASAVYNIADNLNSYLDQFVADIAANSFSLTSATPAETPTATSAVYRSGLLPKSLSFLPNKINQVKKEDSTLIQPGAVSCDGPGIEPIDHREGDQACLSITNIVNDQPETLQLKALNRAVRWSFVVDSTGKTIGILPPKSWVATSAIQLLQTISDALIGSTALNGAKSLFAALSQILPTHYTYTESNESFVTALRSLLLQYEHPSSTTLEFNPNQNRTLSTVAWATKRTSSTSTNTYEYGSLLLSTLTIIILPLFEILLDIPPAVPSDNTSPINSATKSPSPSTKQKLVKVANNEKGCLIDQSLNFIKNMTGSQGNSAFADFANNSDPSSDSIIGLTKSVVSNLAKDPKFLLCAFGDPLWTAAKDGQFGKKLKKITSELSKLNINNFTDLVGEINQPELTDDLRKNIDNWLTTLGVSISESLIDKALQLLPGADILASIENLGKDNQLGGAIFSLTASVVDAIRGFSTLDDVTPYILSDSGTMPTELATYPHELFASGTINVGYPIKRAGTLSTISASEGGVKVSGFWVGGTDHMDAYYQDGSVAYTATLDHQTDSQASTLIIKDFRGRSGPLAKPTELTFQDPNLPQSESEILVIGPDDNFLISAKSNPMARLIVSMPKIGTNSQPSLLYSSPGTSLCYFSCGGNWVSFNKFFFNATDQALVNNQTGEVSKVQALTDFRFDSEYNGSEVMFGSTQYQGFDDKSGSFSTPIDLPAPPISNLNGLPIGFCTSGGVSRLTYPTSGSAIASMDSTGKLLWESNVNPLGTFSSATASYAAQLDSGCDVLASDSRGTISKFSATGKVLWSSRFSYYSKLSDQSAADAFNIDGITTTKNLAIAVSDQDPRILGFSLSTGHSLWRYSLPEPTFIVMNISADQVVVAGVDGAISLLQIPNSQ